MSATYSLQQYTEDLRRITAETDDEDEILAKVGPLAQRVVADKSWIEPRFYAADEEQGFGVFLLHEEPDHSLAVLLVNWMPGRGTPPHDHGTWAVIAGIEGIERNVRYNRLDDGSKPDYAELEVKHEFDSGEGDLVLMKTGGIHKVTNQTDSLTLSLHTYGMHVNYTDRAQFDLERRSCERFILKVED